jgi:glycosyltransferase involved in cell wall biosynthesis
MLFVSPAAYPLGGLATWLDYLVPGLESCGWEARVLLVSGRWHNPQAYLGAHLALPAITAVNPTGSREGRVRSLARTLVETRPDLVASVNIPDLFAAVERLRQEGRPAPRAVMTVHGIESDLFDDMREFRELLDGVVCTNRLACRLAVEQGGVAGERVHYAPYGVDLPEHQERVPAGDALRIAYVGRLEEGQKRVGDLAAIAERLDAAGFGFVLSIAGEGPDAAGLRARLEPLVSGGRVRFLGALQHAEVQARLYPETDVLLVTSSWETGPIVIWEAMVRGVAIVSSRYVGSGLEGALEHGVNSLLFDVADVTGAVHAIRECSDATLRERIAAAGRDLVLARYTVEKSVQAWDEVLAAVLASAPAGRWRGGGRLPASGRLDRWVGVGLAETLRRAVGRSFEHRGPGGEWPHSYGVRQPAGSAFFEHAARLDAGEGRA